MLFKVLTELPVISLLLGYAPLCRLPNGFGVFPAKPPWTCSAKFYPFLSFDSPLEYIPKTTSLITVYYAYTVKLLKLPLMGSFPLQHMVIKELRKDLCCRKRSRTLARIDYLLSVHCSLIAQVLFRT